MRNEIKVVFSSFCVDTMRFYHNEKKIFHFTMKGGILIFISFCVDNMRSVLESAVFETCFQRSLFCYFESTGED